MGSEVDLKTILYLDLHNSNPLNSTPGISSSYPLEINFYEICELSISPLINLDLLVYKTSCPVVLTLKRLFKNLSISWSLVES